MIQKVVLSSAEDKTIFEDLRLRGQELQNVSWRTPPLIEASLIQFLLANMTFDNIRGAMLVLSEGNAAIRP